MRKGPIVIVSILGGAVAGCGGEGAVPDPTPTPAPPAAASARADLAGRAAAAKDQLGISLYALTRPDGSGTDGGDGRRGTVMVVRAGDGGWRVDVPGGALSGTVDVAVAATGHGQFQCPLPPHQPGCARVDEWTAAHDPRVHHVFTDWLDVLTDPAAPVVVAAAAPLPGGDGDCFSVEPSTISLEPPLDAGVYCYRPDGTLTGARLAWGTLTLTSTDPTTPPGIDLPGPVVDADPLPTEAPPPPSPSATPTPEAPPTPESPESADPAA